MSSIIIASGEHEGDYYPLGHRTNVIGRAEQLPIQVLDNEVSRKHLQIRFDQASGKYHALDMQSRNGVFINGNRITGEAVLNHADRIKVGNTELLFVNQDFDDKESAMHQYKKIGERSRPTFMGEV